MKDDQLWYDLAELEAELVTSLGLDLAATTRLYDETARRQIDQVIDVGAFFAAVIEPCVDADGTKACSCTATHEQLLTSAGKYRR